MDNKIWHQCARKHDMKLMFLRILDSPIAPSFLSLPPFLYSEAVLLLQGWLLPMENQNFKAAEENKKGERRKRNCGVGYAWLPTTVKTLDVPLMVEIGTACPSSRIFKCGMWNVLMYNYYHFSPYCWWNDNVGFVLFFNYLPLCLSMISATWNQLSLKRKKKKEKNNRRGGTLTS